jgi:hypothetical protein
MDAGADSVLEQPESMPAISKQNKIAEGSESSFKDSLCIKPVVQPFVTKFCTRILYFLVSKQSVAQSSQ